MPSKQQVAIEKIRGKLKLDKTIYEGTLAELSDIITKHEIILNNLNSIIRKSIGHEIQSTKEDLQIILNRITDVPTTHKTSHIEGGSDEIIGYLITGTDNILSDDTVSNHSSTSWSKRKEHILNHPPDTLKIYFEQESSSPNYTCYAEIRRNGVLVGSSYAKQFNSPAGYVARTQEISGWIDGDKIQLYSKTSAGGNECFVKNFRIMGKLVKLTQGITWS